MICWRMIKSAKHIWVHKPVHKRRKTRKNKTPLALGRAVFSVCAFSAPVQFCKSKESFFNEQRMWYTEKSYTATKARQK